MSPQIEDYLIRAGEELKRALLPELIQLELHYRPGCSTAEWSRRFPELDQTIVDGFSGKSDGVFSTIPGYFIMEELGHGGMGVVYRAADLTLHRHVALKMIHAVGQVSPEHRRRFLGEARAAARLHHPNLVQVFDSGEVDGHPFLVFELVEGGTLVDRLLERRLSCQESAELMETLSWALQFAHDHHIIHRDLKPSNILLRNDGVPQITDFGLAKRLDEGGDETLSGLIVGTPSYMAPEQADSLAVAASPAADIFSLGAILYELLTGQSPFKAASVTETLDLLRTKEPVSPRSINPEIPRDLETICLKCLQKEPSKRYISAKILADELGRFCRGESIIARPVGTLERTGRWCRRNPLPASLAAALILVVITAFFAVSRQWDEAVVQQKRAELNATMFQAERDVAVAATNKAEQNAFEAEQRRSFAEKHLAAAESRFQKAQVPIQELIHLGVELVHQPKMEARGRQALEKASQFRQALLDEKTDDPEARYATASTFHTLAWTLLEHGQLADAESTYSQALAELRDLHTQDPDNRRYLRLLRIVCLERGVALSQMRQPEAIPALQRAVDIHREVAVSRPDSQSNHANLALALDSLAYSLRTTDLVTAEAAAVEALDIRRAQVATANAPREEAMYVIYSLNRLIEWYSSADRFDEAEQLMVEDTDHAQAARKAFPSFLGTRRGYIKTLLATRKMALRHGDPERAESLVHTLEKEVNELLVDFPDNEEMKETAAWVRHHSGILMAKRGETAAGMKIVMQALRDLRALQAQSSAPGRFRSNVILIARASLTVGTRFEFAQEKLESNREWVAQSPDDPAALNSLAWWQLCVKDESLRNAAEAESSARRAAEIEPTQPYYQNTLGVALYYLGRLDEAVIEFERSLELKTPQPAADWCFMVSWPDRQQD